MTVNSKKEFLISFWRSTGLVKSKKVIEAFREVQRENFVLPEYRKDAYADIALPILAGQTISQPSTVMLMLDFLDIKEDSKILEIGVGSGYNAALMSRLTSNKIIAVERIGELVKFAKANLRKSGISNAKVLHADGSKGYEKEAPYDRIIATCGSHYIPDSWKEQLKEGGVLVAPVGYLEQEMIVAKKIKGELKIERKGAFRFVPLVKGKR